MRSNLRNILLTPAFLVAAGLATNNATAQNLKVPFSFNVAGKECPAGVYSVQRDGLGSLVTLRSNASGRSFTWIIAPGNPSPLATQVVLTFDEDGQTHTLRSVQYGSWVTSPLDRSKASKKWEAKNPSNVRVIHGE
jgi:hypothetical protein